MQQGLVLPSDSINMVQKQKMNETTGAQEHACKTLEKIIGTTIIFAYHGLDLVKR